MINKLIFIKSNPRILNLVTTTRLLT